MSPLLLTSSALSCSRSVDALSEATSGSHPASPRGNGWTVQPWLAAQCLRTNGCITAKGEEPAPCPQHVVMGTPYLPEQHKAGISHWLQTPALVNCHQPGALGPPGRVGLSMNAGTGRWAGSAGFVHGIWQDVTCLVQGIMTPMEGIDITRGHQVWTGQWGRDSRRGRPQ